MPLDPAGVRRLEAYLTQLMQAGAKGAASEAKTLMSGAGSGAHYPGNPNPSSRPGEYPSRQSGELSRHITWRRAGPLSAQWGMVDGPGYGVLLEFLPPGAPGYTRRTSAGVRQWLTKLVQDERVQRAAMEGIRGAIR